MGKPPMIPGNSRLTIANLPPHIRTMPEKVQCFYCGTFQGKRNYPMITKCIKCNVTI
ncbi:MAG: hypothetical protein AABY22_03240 [Nanoarchaeota archaeon]